MNSTSALKIAIPNKGALSEGAVKLLLAGADTFQIATVLYTRGIQQISVILDGIRDF